MLLVVLEHDRGALAEAAREGLTLGRTLAAEMGAPLHAALLGSDDGSLAVEAGRFGADVVHTVTHDVLADYGPEAWGETVAGMVRRLGPAAVLACGSDRGNEVMAQAAARLDAPFVANCTTVDPNDWSMTRIQWGGSLLEDAALDFAEDSDGLNLADDSTGPDSPARPHETDGSGDSDNPAGTGDAVGAGDSDNPAGTDGSGGSGQTDGSGKSGGSGNPAGSIPLLTCGLHAVAAAPVDPPVEPEVVAHDLELDAGLARTMVRDRVVLSAGATLSTAPVVVGGGRGVGSAEGFAALGELADLLDGKVGCSRAVTNNGWRPHSDQVGQTGTRIAPEVYIAAGISGAIQHWVGAMASKHILAINIDPEANMVVKADWAVIGDLHTVIPAITAEIRARR